MQTPYEDALKDLGSTRRAAKSLGLPHMTYYDRLKAERKAVKADKLGLRFTDVEEVIPHNLAVKGTTTLYDQDGNKKLTWVKTDKEKSDQLSAILSFAEGLKIKPAKPVKRKTDVLDDLMACYVITDYHIGQYSCPKETGNEWDLKLAEKLLIDWFTQAIESAPNAHTAIFAQLGDLLHFDGLTPATNASGHVLDASGRFGDLCEVVGRVLRYIVSLLLQKHEHVHLIMAQGNHDEHSAIWISTLFQALYENEPRVTVDTSHSPYYCYEHGNTSLFFHHGHKVRIAEMSRTFAGMYREVFGRTKFSYAHTGHYHHVEQKEDSLMIMERHPTLAAKDAYSARGGYNSQRGANVITYSKRFGEISRVTIRPEMVQ